jgi:hypothetical protein
MDFRGFKRVFSICNGHVFNSAIPQEIRYDHPCHRVYHVSKKVMQYPYNRR